MNAETIPEEDDDLDDEIIDLVVFIVGGRKWAIEAIYVVEAKLHPMITPVPGGPSFLSGIVDVKGQVLPLFQADGFLGLEELQRETVFGMLVLGGKQPEFGIVIDQAPAFEMLSTNQIEPLEAQDQTEFEWTIGVTTTGAVLIDGQTLINERNFTIST